MKSLFQPFHFSDEGVKAVLKIVMSWCELTYILTIHKLDKENLVSLQLYGIKQKKFGDHGTIQWFKDGEVYDPAVDGKDVTVKGTVKAAASNCLPFFIF